MADPTSHDPATDATGHRERLRDRLFATGPDALLDHELVEYLLGLSIRRGDTKGLARRLLAEFGGYGPLLTAAGDALSRAGVGETTVGVLRIGRGAVAAR